MSGVWESRWGVLRIGSIVLNEPQSPADFAKKNKYNKSLEVGNDDFEKEKKKAVPSSQKDWCGYTTAAAQTDKTKFVIEW